MPVFSSKMTLFGKAGLYTIIGMVSTTTPPIAPIASDCLLSCRDCAGKVSL